MHQQSKPLTKRLLQMLRLTTIFTLAVIILAIMKPNTNQSLAHSQREQLEFTVDAATRVQVIEDLIQKLVVS
jgi:hypothetical protein